MRSIVSASVRMVAADVGTVLTVPVIGAMMAATMVTACQMAATMVTDSVAATVMSHPVAAGMSAALGEAVIATLLVGQIQMAATRCGRQHDRGTRKQQHSHGESLPMALGLACRGDSTTSHTIAWATAATLRKLGKL